MTVYRTYIPKPPLTEFVELFWLYEGYNPSHSKERVLPNGSLELTINLHDDTQRIYDRHNYDQFQTYRGCVIGGTHSKFLILDTDCQASMVGVHFKPGGAFPFLSVPAGELHEEVVSLDTLWGTAASDLRDQLLETDSVGSKFHILEQFLL